MKLEVALRIKEEVEKQWNAGFLAMVKYPYWVANIVPVPKKDGKVRMCVDYKDLNRASPKNNFPLPHVDLLVDNTTQHSCYSFMDGFSRYNQIRMAPEHKEKTTFITTWETFYYEVMPFGLKNAGAIYQSAMVNLFHDMMHKEVEVYVDDMTAKSKMPGQHINDLLNPAKCTFEVKIGKLLGFIVNKRGIELDSDKVKAIRNMPASKTETEVRGLLGRPDSSLNQRPLVSRYLSSVRRTRRWSGTKNAKKPLRKSSNTWSHLLFSSRQAFDPLPDSAERIHGGHPGATKRLWERTSHLLPQ
ncbi:hypothetical protein CR513_44180, partial [Mucuna pruriens]